tara:strand:+ start:7651 stop:15555 length:7905 start_codon:yes stop_codon:yes gene_type:complete
MSGLETFRAKYPEYNDVGDKELADALYEKYYSSLDRDDYYDQMGLKEETGFFDSVIEAGQRTLGSAEMMARQAPAGFSAMFTDSDMDADEELAEQNRAIAESVREKYGYDEEYDDGTLNLLFSGLGSTIPFFGSSAAGAGAGFLVGGPLGAVLGFGVGTAGGALLGASSNTASYIEEGVRARERGVDVDPVEYGRGKEKAALLGASEAAVPLVGQAFKFLRPFKKSILQDPTAMEALGRRIREIGFTALAEAGQEGAVSYANDMILQKYVDPDTNVGDSLLEEAAAGGFAGATLETLLGFVPGYRRTVSNREEANREEQRLRDKVQQDQADNAARVSADMENQARDDFPSTAVDDRVIAPDLLETTEFAGTAEEVAQQYRGAARRVVDVLRDDFPTEPEFDVAELEVTTEDKPGKIGVVDSQGRLYGSSQPLENTLNNRAKLQGLAGALNGQTSQERIYQNNRLVIDESKETYNPQQVQSLHLMGRRLLGPDSATFSADQVNTAGNTTLELGFPEEMTAEQAQEAGIGRQRQTIAQRINAKRLEKGLPETNRFTITEAKKELGDNIASLTDFISGASESDSFSPVVKGGASAVAVSRDGALTTFIKDRPATAQEKQAAIDAGKEPPKRAAFANAEDARQYAEYLNGSRGAPFLPSREVFGEYTLGDADFIELLKAKNISSDINSPEIKKLAKLFTGTQLRRDQALNDLTASEQQLFYHQLRQVPRFDTPTKLPLFELKPYTKKQVKAAASYLETEGQDMPKIMFEGQFGPTTEKKYQRALSAARALQPDAEPLALPSPEMPSGETVATRDALEKVLRQRLDSLNLPDIDAKITSLIRNVERDADGNIYLRGVAEGADLTTEGGYSTNDQRVIQVALDAIMARADKPQDVEAAVVDVLNHEVLHALRQLDLITESELAMLEKLATKYKKSGTEQTYEQWAIATYPDLANRPTALIEEAVAEMVRDGVAGRVVMESKPVKLTGKPRSIIKRIVDFFRGLFNVARDANASSFTEFLTALEAGEIGLRKRGKIRTLYRLERATGRFLDRDDPFTERDALQQTIAEGAKSVVDEEDIEVRAGQALDQYPRFAQLSLAELEEYSPANPDGKGDYKTDLGVPDEDTYFRLLDAKKRLEQGEATTATEKTPEQKTEEERLAKVAGLDQVMFSRRTPAYASGSGRQIARDQLANDLEQAGIEYEYPLSDFNAGDFTKVKPASRRLIRALEREDFLGYDNLDQLLTDLFETDLGAFDASNALRTALGRFVNESAMADMSEIAFSKRFPLPEKLKNRKKTQQEITKLFSYLNGKTAPEAARELQKRVNNESYSEIADRVAGKLASLEAEGLNTSVKVVSAGEKAPSNFARDVGTLGFFQSLDIFDAPYDSTVFLSGGDLGRIKSLQKAEEVALHELIHAATSHALSIGNRRGAVGTPFGVFDDEISSIISQVVREVNRQIDSGTIDAGGNTAGLLRNALANTREFVAYGMTNPEFQKFLAGVSVEPKNAEIETQTKEEVGPQKSPEPKNLLERFIRAISDFLGITSKEVVNLRSQREDYGSKRKTVSALSEVIQLSDRALKIPEGYTSSALDDLGQNESVKVVLDEISFSRRSANKAVEKGNQRATRKVEEYISTHNIDPIGATSLDAGPVSFSRRAGFFSSPQGTPAFVTPSESMFKKLIFQVQDKLVGLKDIEEAINESRKADGLSPIAVDKSVYRGEETIPGKLGNFQRNFQQRELEPLIQDMSDSKVSIDQIDEFLILRHAIERNDRIRKINPAKDVQDGGAGSISVGGKLQRLTDAYVKNRMLSEFGLKWNDAKGEWSGGNDKGRTYTRLAKKVDDINSTTLLIEEQGGLMTSEERQQISSFYKYYTPLRGIVTREEDMSIETNAKTAGSGGSLSIMGRETDRAMGRKTEAFSPLATIVTERGVKTARAVKNTSVGKRLVELIQDNPNDDVWQLISPDNPRYVNAFESFYTYVGPDTQRYGETLSNISNEPDKKNWVRRIRPKKDPVLNPYADELFGVKIDGQQYYIEFADPSLRKAMINLDGGTTKRAIEFLNYATRWMSYVNTSLNPEFVIGNFARDIQTAIYNIIGEQSMEGGLAKDAKGIVKEVVKQTFGSPLGLVPGIDKGRPSAIKVFYKGYRDPDSLSPEDRRDYDEFIKTGAKTDWFHSRTPEQQKLNIEQMQRMAQGTFRGNAEAGLGAVKNFIDDSNAAVENGVRFATFKVARDKMIENGVPRELAIQQAASLAKNLTVNFNRRGQSGNTLNALYLFFNASVQGTANLVRGLNVLDPNSSRTKQAVVFSMIGLGALFSALAEELLDEEELRNIEDYVRDRNIIIPQALWGGDPKKYSMIPLPYGYNVFHVFGDSMYQVASGRESVASAGSRVGNVMMGSFSPIGASTGETISESMVKTVFPTAFSPIADIAFNSNYFGAPIYPPDSPYEVAQTPLSRRSFSSTPQFYKSISEFLSTGNESQPGFLEIPPDSFGYFIDWGLGGAGAFFERVAFRAVPAAFSDEVELETKDVPFMRRLVGEINQRPKTERYYERRITLAEIENQMNDVLRGAERGAFMQENRDYVKMMPMMKASEKTLRALRQRLKNIRAIEKVSPARSIELAKIEEKIQADIDEIMNKFNNRYDKQIGKNK